ESRERVPLEYGISEDVRFEEGFPPKSAFVARRVDDPSPPHRLDEPDFPILDAQYVDYGGFAAEPLHLLWQELRSDIQRPGDLIDYWGLVDFLQFVPEERMNPVDT